MLPTGFYQFPSILLHPSSIWIYLTGGEEKGRRQRPALRDEMLSSTGCHTKALGAGLGTHPLTLPEQIGPKQKKPASPFRPLASSLGATARGQCKAQAEMPLLTLRPELPFSVLKGYLPSPPLFSASIQFNIGIVQCLLQCLRDICPGRPGETPARVCTNPPPRSMGFFSLLPRSLAPTKE
ncbi:hypothetical protein V8C34DRAFT_272791 [Trichoderma compactum]